MNDKVQKLEQMISAHQYCVASPTEGIMNLTTEDIFVAGGRTWECFIYLWPYPML